ncbi:MAG: RraA family protein [Novosphingobium sp.]|nr:RraA family protein [Novosphingobium sp.]
MGDANVTRIGKLDTATLSDALDRLGIAGQCLGIKPLDPAFRLAGRAFTLLYGPQQPGGTVGDYIDAVPDGSVMMLDNRGIEDMTVWGDILTLVAHRRGLAGTVIEGACRDVHLALDLGYPLFSRSHSMRTGKDRVQLDATGVPITIGGVRVLPGDLVRGDCDGVVVLPRGREDEVLDAAEAIEAAEEEIRKAVLAGERLTDARARLRYHSLQTRTGGAS